MLSSVRRDVDDFRFRFSEMTQEERDVLINSAIVRLGRFQYTVAAGCGIHALHEWELFDYVAGRILGRIGSGSSADVLLMQSVIDPHKLSAVKKFDIPTHSKSEYYKAFDQFFHEAKMLQSIEHESIVKIEATMTSPLHGVICLPFYERGSLRGHVEELTVPQIQHYFSQLCCGLRYLHRNGIVHRDVKLENILVRDDYNIVLTDFGLSERVDVNDAMVTGRVGTAGYMAPEVAAAGYDGILNGFRADAYSVGVVIWCLLHKERIPMDTIVVNFFGKCVRDGALSFCMYILLQPNPWHRLDVVSLLDQIVLEWSDNFWVFDKSVFSMG